MNLYFCLSEQLESRGSEYEPPEYYCIAEFVVAETRAKAKYMAFRTDKELFGYGVSEMPKMSVRIVVKDTNLPAGPVYEDVVGMKYTDELIKFWKFDAEDEEGYRDYIDELKQPS